MPVLPSRRPFPPLFPVPQTQEITTNEPATTFTTEDQTESYTETVDFETSSVRSETEPGLIENEMLSDNVGSGVNPILFKSFDKNDLEVAKILTDLHKIVKSKPMQIVAVFSGMITCLIAICWGCVSCIRCMRNRRVVRTDNNFELMERGRDVQVNEVSSSTEPAAASSSSMLEFPLPPPPYMGDELHAGSSSVITHRAPTQNDYRRESSSSDELFDKSGIKMKRK